MTLSGARPVVFVHGFLGLARDWLPFARQDRGDRLVDLWPATTQLAGAADPFAVAVAEILKDLPEKPVLVAYSMGARLAMQALIEAPEAFHSAVLVSGHPGLADSDERSSRLKADQIWAARFRQDPWDELLAAWNGQAVLHPGHSPEALVLERTEKDFDREALARAMEYWSLGRQRDLRTDLAKLRLPLFFLTGALDSKFSVLARALEFGEHHEVAHAGHRVPWEQPSAFRKLADLAGANHSNSPRNRS